LVPPQIGFVRAIFGDIRLDSVAHFWFRCGSTSAA
jgi:hypothetical protein